MAKLSFTKLGLKKDNNIKIINYNDQIIEVKQYISIQEKLQLISNIIEKSADLNSFANPIKVKVFTDLEIIDFYTNITFTDKQREDVVKTYDLIYQNNFMNIIIQALPENEYQNLITEINNTISELYKYRNSIMGLLDILSTDYSNLNFDLADLQSKIQSEEFNLLRDIAPLIR